VILAKVDKAKLSGWILSLATNQGAIGNSIHVTASIEELPAKRGVFVSHETIKQFLGNP
jgi:hypothetical protein